MIQTATRSGKQRWHALLIFGDNAAAACALVKQYRQRQQQEQRYRIMLHDALVDSAPSGSDRRSPNPSRLRVRPVALSLYASAVALATDALERFATRLGEPLGHCHPRTLRRYLLGLPSELNLIGPTACWWSTEPRICALL